MSRAKVAAGVALALAAVALACVPAVEHYAAGRIKEQIEQDGRSTVDSVDVSLFRRSVTLNNVRFQRDGTLSAQRWSFSGLSMPFDRLLQGQLPGVGLRPGDPVHAGHVAIDGLSFLGAAARAWFAGSVAIDDFDLAPYDGNVGQNSSASTILGARILRALSMHHFEMHDFTYSEGDPAGGIAAAAMTIDDARQGTLGMFELTGLQAASKTTAVPLFRLEQFKAAGLDFSGLLASMSAASWRMGTPLARVRVQSASASGFGGESLSRYGISLGSVTTETTSEGKAVSHLRTRVEGFVLAPPLTGLEGLRLRTVLAAMGLKEVRLGFDCTGTEEREKGEVTVDACALSSPDLARIDFSASLQQADEPFWRAVDADNLALLLNSKIVLSSAKLVLADHSLLERAIKAMAVSSGQSAAAARAALALQVRQFQPAGVMITDDMTKLLDTLARFVENGGTLTLELKPDPPLGIKGLGALQRPSPDLIELLGVTATLSPP